MFMFGCSEESTLISPEASNSESGEPNWVGLPARAGSSLNKTFSSGKFISKDKDEEIVISETYTSISGKTVSIYAQIIFFAGTLKEDTFITMEMDDETGVISFSPSMEFNKPALLNVTLTGLILKSLSSTEDFKYLAASGGYESVVYNDLFVKVSEGGLQLDRGQIPHFSRYGFTR